MNGFDGAFIPATSPLRGWSIDRHLAAAAIFCEIFSRHHFPVRCVTFYTREPIGEFISYIRRNNCLAAPMTLFLRRYNIIFHAFHRYPKIAFSLLSCSRYLQICIIAHSAAQTFQKPTCVARDAAKPQNATYTASERRTHSVYASSYGYIFFLNKRPLAEHAEMKRRRGATRKSRDAEEAAVRNRSEGSVSLNPFPSRDNAAFGRHPVHV